MSLAHPRRVTLEQLVYAPDLVASPLAMRVLGARLVSRYCRHGRMAAVGAGAVASLALLLLSLGNARVLISGISFGALLVVCWPRLRSLLIAHQTVDLTELFRGSVSGTGGEFEVDLRGYLEALKCQVTAARQHHPDMSVMFDSVLWDVAVEARHASALAGQCGDHDAVLARCAELQRCASALHAFVAAPAGDIFTEAAAAPAPA